MDSALIPKGVKRCPAWKFYLGLVPVNLVLLWGTIAMILVYFKGLNQTNMNNAYGFALWIWADLAIIALGGGAFFTGLLRYIIGKDELKNIVNYAVLVGFYCYVSALMILGFDVGQPLRGWFIFWHANVHSMLTEVAVFAATGAFLSFFHQGSLGGVPGVMYARPFGFREGIFVWPWTFFLFTWSAAACGPCFTILITKITETITRKKLVKDNVIELLAKISGWMMATYMVAKIIDTLHWATVTAPSKGFRFMDFYTNNPGSAYGLWILIVELGCGLLAAGILITSAGRKNNGAMWVAVICGVLMVSVNRWVMVLQVLAAPVLSFEVWAPYIPSWQEVATTLLPVALGIVMVALSYRYLPIFPQEPELNPIEPEEGVGDAAEDAERETTEADTAQAEPALAAEGEPEPA